MIQALNKYGQSLGAVDFIEAQWKRRWNSAGEFYVYMAQKDYNPDAKYIVNVGRPEIGIIQKLELSNEISGTFITLSGFFIEKIADFGAYKKPYNVDASSVASVKSEINTYLGYALQSNGPPTVNGYTINADSVFPGSVEMEMLAGVQAGKALYDLFADSDYSYVCSPIWNNKSEEATEPLIGLDFTFKKGRDLTNQVFFGKAYGNLVDSSYILDESAEVSFYRILHQVESLDGWTTDGKFSVKENGETKNYIEVWYQRNTNRPSNMGYAFPHKVLKVSLSDIEITTENQAKIISQMKQQALLDMLNNYKIESINVNVLQERFKYITDYDLGDKCTICIEELGQIYNTRIMEVYETYKNNTTYIEIVFGTPQKMNGGTSWLK